ncbi:cutinase family protein [Nocardioides cheoyonin]|uniref:cutinase family protein n=1 Tax=Nocardioides cheoyonin TaxID=3156615 RepID=UPI0032B39931
MLHDHIAAPRARRNRAARRRGVLTGRSGAALVAVTAVLAAALSLPAVSPASAATSTPTTVSCPSLELMVVRGSGEKTTNQAGYGKLWTAVSRVLHKVPGVDVSYDTIGYGARASDHGPIAVGGGGVKYPALYKKSVANGEQHLKAAIHAFTTGSCGSKTGIYLIGYSQGAQVVGNVYQTKLSTADKRHVKAIALLGDPRFAGNQKYGINVGTYSHRLNGVWDISWARDIAQVSLRALSKVAGLAWVVMVAKHWAGTERHWAKAAASKVRSFCAKGDPICNTSPGNLEGCFIHKANCVHSRYGSVKLNGETYMNRVGDWIVSRWKANGGRAGAVANIRNINFKNAVVPGSVCGVAAPIRLSGGHGKVNSQRFADTGAVRYADATGDGKPEAWVAVSCNNGSGTVDGEIRENLLIYTQTPTGLRLLGAMFAHPNWPGGAIPTVFTTSKSIGYGRIQTRENFHGSYDASCCGSNNANVIWTRHFGKLVSGAPAYTPSLYLVTPTGIGRARLGMTLAQLKKQYKVAWYDAPTASWPCGTAAFGSVYNWDTQRNETAALAVFKNGKITELDSWSAWASTVGGVGKWAQIGIAKKAFPKNKITVLKSSTGAPNELHIRFASSTIAFPYTYDSDIDETWTTSGPSVYQGTKAHLLQAC